MTTATVVTTSTGSIAIAYDYSPYLERIAAALEAIAATGTYIATVLGSIAETHSAISRDINIVSTQSTGTGIHTVGAHDWLGHMALYRLFVEEGKILDTSSYVTSSTEALAAVEEYVSKINNLPTSF